MRALAAVSAVVGSLVFGAASQGSPHAYRIELRAFSDSETAVSGVGGGKRGIIGGGSNGALRGIDWSEDGDLPCQFQSYVKGVDTLKTSNGSYWEKCPGQNWGNKKTITIPLNLTYEFVRGVAICDNGKSTHRLKGIRLWKGKIATTPQGGVAATYPYLDAYHTNCKKWKKDVYCPSGYVAVQFVLHHFQQSGTFGKKGQAVEGISLICKEVIWTQV